MDISLPVEIIKTNKKLHELWVKAKSAVLEAKLQIGTDDQLEELDKMANQWRVCY